jgi:membrane-associated protease RseP (regulator of RpoE activity)
LMSTKKLKRTVVGFVAAVCCLFLVQTAAFAQEETAEAEQEPGVVIVAVQPESAAATAGLRRGDIILRLTAIELDNAEELAAVVHAAGAEATVTLDILHGDEERQLEITLGARNGQAFLGVTPYRTLAMTQVTAPFAPAMPAPVAPPAMPPLGSQGEEVSFQVIEVLPDSPAAVAGLQVGQRIVGVNGSAFAAQQGLVEVVRSHQPGDLVTLTIAAALTETQAVTATQVVTVELTAAPDDEDAAYLGIRIAPMVTMRAGAVQAGVSAPQVRLFRHGSFEAMPVLPTLPGCQCGGATQPQHFFFQQLPSIQGDVVISADQEAVTVSRLATPATPADTLDFSLEAQPALPAMPRLTVPTEERLELQIEILDDQI